jgi:hypothetical protein
LRWVVVSSGKETASMGFQSHLGEESGITLTTKPQPFGGRRWFFLCPRTGERATKLHLPSGAYTFASRKAYRLGYRCQRETPRDRSLSRAFALRSKIGGTGGIGDYIAKPKGMHRRTFERAMERIYGAEEIVEAHLTLQLARLRRRSP